MEKRHKKYNITKRHSYNGDKSRLQDDFDCGSSFRKRLSLTLEVLKWHALTACTIHGSNVSPKCSNF